MNNLKQYSTRFFQELEVYEDLARGHSYKIYLQQAVLDFLENETKETAFAVYEAFFDSYRITLKGNSNPFIDLLDILRLYEENAATLISKQRDHYIHSVIVFILGLSNVFGAGHMSCLPSQLALLLQNRPGSESVATVKGNGVVEDVEDFHYFSFQ